MPALALDPATAGAAPQASGAAKTSGSAAALAAAGNNVYKKTVYKAGSTTPATQVAPGDNVTYVIDLGANNTEPPGWYGSVALWDQLAAGHTSVTTPTLPAGWSSPATPIPGANTAIGAFDLGTNTPAVAAYGAPMSLKPNMASNSWDGTMQLDSSATSFSGGGGDGMYAYTYTNGVGGRQFLAVNHAGSNMPCFNYPP